MTAYRDRLNSGHHDATKPKKPSTTQPPKTQTAANAKTTIRRTKRSGL